MLSHTHRPLGRARWRLCFRADLQVMGLRAQRGAGRLLFRQQVRCCRGLCRKAQRSGGGPGPCKLGSHGVHTPVLLLGEDPHFLHLSIVTASCLPSWGLGAVWTAQGREPKLLCQTVAVIHLRLSGPESSAETRIWCPGLGFVGEAGSRWRAGPGYGSDGMWARHPSSPCGPPAIGAICHGAVLRAARC